VRALLTTWVRLPALLLKFALSLVYPAEIVWLPTEGLAVLNDACPLPRACGPGRLVPLSWN
jgi:hypothetical protein